MEQDVISLSPLTPVPQSFPWLQLQEKKLLLNITLKYAEKERVNLCMGNKLFSLNWRKPVALEWMFGIFQMYGSSFIVMEERGYWN